MKNISIIAAIGKNYELGKDNKLLWHLKGDMAFFKEHTMNKYVVMGRKTFESLPKMLSNRKYIVLTRQNHELNDDIIVMHSIEELIKYIYEHDEEFMIIGGENIYRQLLDYADKIYLTKIDDEKNADSFFPRFNENEWNCSVLDNREENKIKYKHLLYEKK